MKRRADMPAWATDETLHVSGGACFVWVFKGHADGHWSTDGVSKLAHAGKLLA